MRCHLTPELSAGEFMDVVDIAARASAAQLLVDLVPLGLTAAERRELLEEFDLARAQVLFYMTAKTSYLTEEPWRVLQCAHTDRELSHRAIRRALHSRRPRPITRKLRGELRPECELYLNGTDLGSPDVKMLACLLGAFRIFPISERSIEGQHAKTHKRGLGRHNHTEHCMSLGLRAPELQASIKDNLEVLKDLALYCQVIPNAQRVCEVLGLSNHPSIWEKRKVATRRYPVFGKVVYHAGSHALYRAAMPDLETGDDPNEDGDCSPNQEQGGGGDSGNVEGGGSGPHGGHSSVGATSAHGGAGTSAGGGSSGGANTAHGGIGTSAGGGSSGGGANSVAGKPPQL